MFSLPCFPSCFSSCFSSRLPIHPGRPRAPPLPQAIPIQAIPIQAIPILNPEIQVQPIFLDEYAPPLPPPPRAPRKPVLYQMDPADLPPPPPQAPSLLVWAMNGVDRVGRIAMPPVVIPRNYPYPRDGDEGNIYYRCQLLVDAFIDLAGMLLVALVLAGLLSCVYNLLFVPVFNSMIYLYVNIPAVSQLVDVFVKSLPMLVSRSIGLIYLYWYNYRLRR